MKSWRRAWRKIREVGPLYTAHLAANRFIPEALFQVRALMITERDPRHRPSVLDHDPGFRWITLEDFNSIAALRRLPRPLWAELEAGNRALILERDDDVISYFLYPSDSHHQASWVRFEFLPTDIWTIYTWVAPEYRGQGIHAHVRNFAASELEQAGYTRELSTIDALNRNSLRAHTKLGGWFIGRIFFLRILGLTLVRVGRSVRIGWWGPNRPFVVDIKRFESKLVHRSGVLNARLPE